MKKQLSTLLFLALMTLSYGQIVITDNDLAPVGTTIFMANDTLPANDIVPGESGADKTWDFTNVVAHTLDTMDFVLPASTPFASEFPEANFAITFVNENFYLYMIRNADKLSRIGMTGFTEDGDTLFMHVDPEDILLDFPVTYGDSYDETYVTEFKLPLPEQEVDSVWIKNTINKETDVDAWGSVTIPMGTFDALRQRVDIVEADSTFIMMNGTNIWILFSATLDSSTNYSWLTDAVNIGFELCEMDVDRVSSDVTHVWFMNSLPVDLFENKSLETRVFPNPVTDVMNIEFEEAQTGELTLLNQMGQIVHVEKLEGQNRVQLQLSMLPAGIYIYRLSNAFGEIAGTGKFVKR